MLPVEWCSAPNTRHIIHTSHTVNNGIRVIRTVYYRIPTYSIQHKYTLVYHPVCSFQKPSRRWYGTSSALCGYVRICPANCITNCTANSRKRKRNSLYRLWRRIPRTDRPVNSWKVLNSNEFLNSFDSLQKHQQTPLSNVFIKQFHWMSLSNILLSNVPQSNGLYNRPLSNFIAVSPNVISFAAVLSKSNDGFDYNL